MYLCVYHSMAFRCFPGCAYLWNRGRSCVHDIANPVHSSDCESAWSNPSFVCKHGWGKCSSCSGLWPCNMVGCPCRNSVVAKKRFVREITFWVVTIYLLILISIPICIGFILVTLRIEPVKTPTKMVTIKRVRVCQMESGPTNTSVLHLSALILKLFIAAVNKLGDYFPYCRSNVSSHYSFYNYFYLPILHIHVPLHLIFTVHYSPYQVRNQFLLHQRKKQTRAVYTALYSRMYFRQIYTKTRADFGQTRTPL